MRAYIAVAFVLLALVLVGPPRVASARTACSEGERITVSRLVGEHKKKIEEAEAAVDRQRTLNANEAVLRGHVGYPNQAKLITFEHQLAEWRQVADHDSARYTACFGYPPIALAGLGTARRGYAAPKPPPPEEKTQWSGTWYDGPYVIQISGGNGSLSYTALRQSDVGTCCPTIDQGSGSCSVKGSVATCSGQGHFHNSASDIWTTSRTTLTYQGGYIGVKSHILSSREKTDQYHPCPESGPAMSKCTSLYEGNDLEATWSRQKP